MQTFLDFAARNWLLFAAFLAILVTLLVTEFLRLSRGVKAIGVQDALRRLNDETAVLVDVRDPGEFRNGHISGARHLPAGEFDRRIGELDKYRDRELIVCCQHGNRSAPLAAKLKKAGFASVMNLAGGVAAWTGAGLPLVRK